MIVSISFHIQNSRKYWYWSFQISLLLIYVINSRSVNIFVFLQDVIDLSSKVINYTEIFFVLEQLGWYDLNERVKCFVAICNICNMPQHSPNILQRVDLKLISISWFHWLIFSKPLALLQLLDWNISSFPDLICNQ